MRLPRTPVCLTLLILAASLTGCGGQRSLPAVTESGNRAYSDANYEQALADYAEFVERLPGEPQGRYNYGRALLKLNRPAEAREQLWIAYSRDPLNDDYFDALAESLYASNQREQLFSLLRQRTLDRGRNADYIRLADYARRAGDVDTAEGALLTAARLDEGRSIEPQLALADLYASVNDDHQALQRLRMAYSIDPKNLELLKRIRGHGEIPGPSFGIPPAEQPEPRP